MTRRTSIILLVTTALVLPGAAAMAAGVHEHGGGSLSIAVETRTLDAILTAPLGDLLGTERVPTDAAGRRALREALERLERFDPVVPQGATCTRANVRVDVPEAFRIAAASAPPDGDHTEHEVHEEVHHEGTVHWTWRCEGTPSIVVVDFPQLAPMTALRTQGVGAGGQRSARLTPTAPRFLLP